MFSSPVTLRVRDMKKKARKAGRPPLPEDERRESPVPVRFRDEERQLIDRAAEKLEIRSVSAFVRDAAVKEARRVLGE